MTTSFDDRARTWDDDPSKVERAARVAQAIRAAVPTGSSIRMLEYGAGTGLLSQALSDAVGPVTLADTSQGMREVMAEKVAAGRLPADARIWDLDLAQDAAPAETFDLVVTVMTLHHIPDLEPVLEGFAALLAADGHLCVVDLEAEDGSFHRDHADFEGHDGFEPAALTEQLEAAGFRDIRYERCHEVERDGARYPLFLAVATTGPRP